MDCDSIGSSRREFALVVNNEAGLKTIQASPSIRLSMFSRILVLQNTMIGGIA